MALSPLIRRIRVGMTAAGPVVTTVLRLTSSRVPSKRRRWILIAAAAVAITAFLAIAQTPMIIANTATAALFGAFDSDDPQQQPPPANFCAPIPTIAPSPEPPPSAEGSPVNVKRDPLDPDGRPTQQTLQIVAQVPADAELDTATAWILFRLAHPDEIDHADYRAFGDAYTSTRAAMSPNATPLDVVSTMDPSADYSPFLLIAQAATYRLVRQGSVAASEAQIHALIAALGATCAGPDRGPTTS